MWAYLPLDRVIILVAGVAHTRQVVHFSSGRGHVQLRMPFPSHAVICLHDLVYKLVKLHRLKNAGSDINHFF